MELVPIIKEILLVVTILFVIVIAVSYVAAKLKKEKPPEVKKLSPEKKIRQNIKIVHDSRKLPKSIEKKENLSKSKKHNVTETPAESRKQAAKQKPKVNVTLRNTNKKQTAKSIHAKKNYQKPQQHKIEKRIEIIKDLNAPKNRINKNDSGGIGFN